MCNAPGSFENKRDAVPFEEFFACDVETHVIELGVGFPQPKGLSSANVDHNIAVAEYPRAKLGEP